MSIASMLCLPGLVPVFTKSKQKMYFEVQPSFLRTIRSVPFTIVHCVKTGAIYQFFCDGHNLSVSVWVLNHHGFLSILDLLHEGYKLCFSADWALHPLVDFINVLACESSVLGMEMSEQSKKRYSCIRRVFFLECAIVHFQN